MHISVRYGKGLLAGLLGLLFLLGSCDGKKEPLPASGEALHLPGVISRYLDFPVPSGGIEATFNAPVLRWPAVRDQAARYDVLLSQDREFRKGEVLQVSGTPWAMFNPHRELAAGKWFWQYRVEGGAWSEVLMFTIGEEAVPMVSPAPEQFLEAIPRSHPRVLAGRTDLGRLRALAEEADAQAILAQAGNALRLPIPAEKDGLPTRESPDEERNRKLKQDASKRLGDFALGTIRPLAQAYLLTGEERYAERAIQIALEVAGWDPRGISHFSDFSDSRCMLGMALAYDTFYSRLRPEERARLLEAISARASFFYKSWISDTEAKVLSGHFWQHILHYFFQTALAVYGETPEAADWLAYAYEIFLARAPVLGGTDGGWAEGVSYFRMNMETLIDIPLYIKQYTGFDFIRAHPWYEANIDWMVFCIPPGSSSDGFGDNAEEVHAPGASYVAYATEMAKLLDNGLALWYARECRKYGEIDLSKTSTLRWVRLTRTRDLPLPVPAAGPSRSAQVFREIGHVVMHSDPGNLSGDLMLAMRSSPLGCYGHFLADQNAFNILYGGDRTFFRTGYKVTMKDPHRTGWYQHTKSNNSVLIDGEGQPYSTEAFGWISRFLEGKEISYAKADASNAYSSKETGEDYGLSKFYRHVVLLKPDIIVIYDELSALRDVHWSWLIHSMEEIDLDRQAGTGGPAGTFRSDFGAAKGAGKLWASAPVEWALKDTFDVAAVNWRRSRNQAGELKAYDDEQYHLTATSAEKTSGMRFLAILQVSPGASLENFSLAGPSGKDPAGSALSAGTSSGERAADGTPGHEKGEVDVTIGKWRIRAVLDEQRPPGLRITDAGGTTAFATHGAKLSIAGETYPAHPGGAARLAETAGGEPQLLEATDRPPSSIRQYMLYHDLQSLSYNEE